MDALTPNAMGRDLARLEGESKVRGVALYAAEHVPVAPDGSVPSRVHLAAVQATIARGLVTGIDTAAAAALDGVLRVLTHEDAPGLSSTAGAELAVLQGPEVGFRGQFVAAVVAETSEVARHAAALVTVAYETDEHDAAFRADHPDRYRPETVNPSYEPDTEDGDVDAALAAAVHTVDHTYTTPMEYNNPMEPHATVALRHADGMTVWDSTQAAHGVRTLLADLLDLSEDDVRVVAPHVGGGFGAKGEPHANVVLAAMAALAVPGRAVSFVLTRHQMFSVVGYRPATSQRIQLGANADGHITATAHDVVEQTARIEEYGEQTAVVTRTMYASSSARRTTHRLVPLDVPVPSWMRAPGEFPGMVALEIAVDELAEACGLDPIELRVRNDPTVDAETGLPYSSRNLVACLRAGAERFGWADRDPTPRSRRDGEWWLGTGVASAHYPVHAMPGSRALVRADAHGCYRVAIGAIDIGTGARTVLTQIAADALEVDPALVDLHLGDTDLPHATVAGGSSGTASWGSAIVAAARQLRAEHGNDPPVGAEVTTAASQDDEPSYAMHAFGAHFAEVAVNAVTGEVRVPRMLGVFAAGRIINPRTARSQFLGGMVMGLSAALHEHGVLDPHTGHVVNHDLAQYHVAANADVGDIEAIALDEDDPHVNAMGSKGIGEIGIVGAPAAIANAAHHATGRRIRDLPLTPDRFLG